ncbi:hypothetical protein K1W54_04775 [Micromonospora sp. CPCC 205371]|nr:hypothetical protein [Micromonospora sp. CPCC 205371]
MTDTDTIGSATDAEIATTPVPEVLTKLADVVRDERTATLDDLMVAVLSTAADSPPSPLRDAVIALAEQAWAEEYDDQPTTVDVDLPEQKGS